MANFQTHLTCAVVSSSLAASAALSFQLVNQQEVIALWLIGTFGGILPDVDSDNSTAMKIIFTIQAVIMALFVAQWLSPSLSIIGLWLVGALMFVLIRFVLIKLVAQVTVHRGSLHSLLACLMFGLITLHLNLFVGASLLFSWCAGVALVLGMLVHLFLDELYSVDFANRNIKLSFGSALKVCSLNYPLATFSQIAICTVLIYLLPDPIQLISIFQQPPVPFMPNGDWLVLRDLLFNLWTAILT